MGKRCYYDVLEVDMSISQESLQSAYRKMVKKWHPDICKHPSAEEKIKEINEAYDILKDQYKRDNYDNEKGYNQKKKDGFTYSYNYKSNSFNKTKTDDKEKSKTTGRTSLEKEIVYRWAKKYLGETQLKAYACEFPNVDLISIIDEVDKIVVTGYFHSLNLTKQKIKIEYTLFLTKSYKLIKIDFKNNADNYYKYQEKKDTKTKSKESGAYKNFRTKENSNKTQDTVVIGFDIFKKNKYVLILIFIVISIVYLNTYFSKPKEKTQKPSITSTLSDTSFSENVYMKKTINELKEKMDDENPTTRKFYLNLASQSPGNYNIGQIASIYNYLYKNWKYVNDPQGRDYYAKASESIESSLAGDCDDFAILMATCIKGIGGRPKIVFAENGSSGHAYTVVHIADNEEEAKKTISEMRGFYYNTYGAIVGEVYYNIDKNGGVWLNLDWTESYPGGKYFEAAKEWNFDMSDYTFSFYKKSE